MAGSLALTTTMRVPAVGPSKYGVRMDGRTVAARYGGGARPARACPQATPSAQTTPSAEATPPAEATASAEADMRPEAEVWQALVREVFEVPKRVWAQAQAGSPGASMCRRL